MIELASLFVAVASAAAGIVAAYFAYRQYQVAVSPMANTTASADEVRQPAGNEGLSKQLVDEVRSFIDARRTILRKAFVRFYSFTGACMVCITLSVKLFMAYGPALAVLPILALLVCALILRFPFFGAMLSELSAASTRAGRRMLALMSDPAFDPATALTVTRELRSQPYKLSDISYARTFLTELFLIVFGNRLRGVSTDPSKHEWIMPTH